MAANNKSTKKPSFSDGQMIEVSDYPFVRTVFNGYDDRGEYQDEGWRPGCDKNVNNNGRPAFGAGALGAMLLEVVQVVTLPGKFPARVFYVRRWRDPDGKEFGKPRLRVTTTAAFAKLTKGYRHPYFLDGEEVFPVGHWAHVARGGA